MAVRIELELLAARAQGLAAAARIPEARDMVAGQREHHAHEAGFWVMFGSLLLANEEPRAAKDAAQQALSLEPDSLGAIDLLTQCAYRGGDIERALGLARLMVQGAPGLARPHRWVALALLGRADSRTDLEQAREAIELALEIEPGNPEHHVVASAIAALARDAQSMRQYLRAGLGFDPTNPELLRLATLLDDSGEVAGDKRAVLRGLLAVNPMDPGAREDLAQGLLQALVPWGLLVWVYGMLSVLLVHLGPGAAAMAAGLGLAGIVSGAAWWIWRRAGRQLPGGFARDVLRESVPARRSLWLLLVSGAAVLVGGFVGLVGSWQVAGLGIVGAGTSLGFAGWTLLGRAACDPPRKPVQAVRRDAYLNRRLELLLGTRRPRFWIAVAAVPAVAFSFTAEGPAPGMALLIGASWVLGVGLELAWLTAKLGPTRNPWARGSTMAASPGRRGAALVAGTGQAVLYIGSHVLLGLIVSSAGLAFFLNPGELGQEVPAEPRIVFEAPPSQQSPVPRPRLPSLPSFDFGEATPGPGNSR